VSIDLRVRFDLCHDSCRKKYKTTILEVRDDAHQNSHILFFYSFFRWDYSETDSLDWEYQQKRLLTIMEGVSWQRNENVQLLFQQGRYTRALFTDSKTAEQSIGEFYFTPNDTTVQFRLASSSNASLLSTKNLNRSEALRKQLGYLKLPVLRNRKRTLFFGESDLDSFGPGSASLGPPAEMRTRELEGIDG
jgi:hypothetical protein